MRNLKGKTLFITGGSRGIGLAIAVKAARDGANIAIAAKSDTPHPKLPGTIHTAAAAIREAGGEALPMKVDIRNDADVAAAVANTVATFGGIDICVNNASAISLTGTLATDMKRYDLMHDINARGAFLVSKLCLPHLLQAQVTPHILMLSPPLQLIADWFAPHPAYAVSKYAMSLYVMALAAEFRGRVAVNALWPRTTIATAAIANVVGGVAMMKQSRKPEIMADAAYAIFTGEGPQTGNFYMDDAVLAASGVSDFDKYSVEPGSSLELDFFVARTDAPHHGKLVT